MLVTENYPYSYVLEKVITPTALILIDGDVVKTYFNADAEISNEALEENVEAIWDLIKNRRVYHLVVPDSTTLITMDPHNHRNPRFESIKKAEALIIKTLGHRILANVYANTRKDGCPIRVFEHEKDAIEWFDSLRAEEDEA